MLDGWHPSMIKICAMHTLQLGLLMAANGGALHQSSIGKSISCLVSLRPLNFLVLPLQSSAKTLGGATGQGTHRGCEVAPRSQLHGAFKNCMYKFKAPDTIYVFLKAPFIPARKGCHKSKDHSLRRIGILWWWHLPGAARCSLCRL